MKKHLVTLFFCFYVIFSQASHIVGGNVSYQYLGSNVYKITFKLYRDCDANVTVGFDGDSSIIGTQRFTNFFYTISDRTTGANVAPTNNILFFKSKKKISSAIVNDCIDTNQSCVEEAIYETFFTVPDPSRSYVIMHSRCCRNNGINNIEPISSGMGSNSPGLTIYTIIPPTNTYGNTSAVFKKFPPLFLCTNQLFNFDHSASDADGDVLRYYLVTPLNGGNAASPTVNTVPLSAITDYTTWKTPYNLANVIGGNPSITIDSTTGLMTCKPDVTGRYVVAVMVKEYRGGIVIDSAIRDFQFNVMDCDIPITDFPYEAGTFDVTTQTAIYKTHCTSKTLPILLGSTNATRFLWVFGDPASGSADTSTSKTPSHTYSDTGTYLVRLISYRKQSTGQECIDTLKRYIKIYPDYVTNFSFTPSNSATCPGMPISFTDLTYGTYGGAVKWEWDFGNGSKSTLANPVITYSNAGTYIVKLKSTSAKKCIDDTTLTITINPNPTILATIPPACLDQILDIKCNVTIPAPQTISSYKWTLPDGSKLNNCDIFYTPKTSGTQVLNLWAISNIGCKDSQNFTLNVNPLPIIKTGNDTTLCYDKSITLLARGGNSYEWTPNTYLSNAAISNPIASPPYPNSFSYIVKGTDANKCFNFDTIQISFYTKPFISAGMDTNVCLNPSPFKFRDSVRLTGQGAFSTVYWLPAAGLNNANIANPLSKPTKTTDYIFHGIDANQCIVKDTINVLVLDPNLDLIDKKDVLKCLNDTLQIVPLDQGIISKYLWSPATWVSNQNVKAPLFTSLDTILYILFVENYCYSKYDSITVNVPDLPTSNMPDIDSICSGDLYTFNLNSIHNYQWNTNDITLSSLSISNPTCSPTITNSYFITITDQYNCESKDSMKLIVNYPPSISLIGLKNYLCKGDSMWLKLLTDNKATVLWFENKYISSDTARQIYAYPPSTKTYYMKVSSAINCFSIDSFQIKVEEPIKTSGVVTPVRYCKGGYVDLKANGGLYYRWLPPFKINDTLIATPQVNPDITFSYKVLISNNCFTDSANVMVIVDSIPKVKIEKDTTIYRGANLVLLANSSANQFEWSPKDEISNPFVPSVNVSPLINMDYTVSVTDDFGCIGVDTVHINVYGKDVLLIPTGFSPNNDGINDLFGVISHLNVKKLNTFEVFNRWGERVYSTSSINGKWDGTLNNSPCPAGSYIWNIDLTNYEGQKIKKSGTIELLR